MSRLLLLSIGIGRLGYGVTLFFYTFLRSTTFGSLVLGDLDDFDYLVLLPDANFFLFLFVDIYFQL